MLNTPGGQTNFKGQNNIKMNSQHRRNTQCANFQQNLTTFKNHYLRRVLNIWGGVKCPPQGVTTTFWGQNNIKNEISTIKLLRVQIFSKNRQLLKNHYLNIWQLKTPGGSQQLFGVEITSKLKSPPSNYAECTFSAKSDNF